MVRKKVILCLDWSNLAFRSLYASNGFGSGGNFDTEDEINSFIGKMATDLSYILRIFNANKIVFAADARHPWRKDILNTYKSNRVKTAKYNWDNIFAGLNAFQQHLEKLGFAFIEQSHAEADDLMAIVKELVMDDDDFSNYNLIFVTADADIRQLINFKKDTMQYIMVFNEIASGRGYFKHLYCNSDTEEWIKNTNEKNDIFFSGYDPDIIYIKNILENNKKIKLEEVNPDNILLYKIFCGDDGDMVPSFYEWYNNKGKKIRITNSKFNKILNEMQVTDITTLESRKNELKNAMEKTIALKISDIDILERLHRQEKLVDLNSSLFPENIKTYKNDIKNIISSEKELPSTLFNMKSLISGTPFDKYIKTKGVKEFELFKDISDDFIKELNKYKN